MPIYEYACPQCKAVVEVQRRIAEKDDPVACTKCEVDIGDGCRRRKLMERIISAPAPLFPGAGSWRG